MILMHCFQGPLPTGSHFLSAESAVKGTLHHSPITSLVLSPDHQHLSTAGEDSCIFIMKIISSEPQNLRSAAQIQYSEDVLISRSGFVEQLRTLRQAQHNVQKLENEQHNKLQSLKQGFKQKRKQIKNNIKEEQDSEKADVEGLKKQIAALTDDAEAQ
jgi:hypothetical protein